MIGLHDLHALAALVAERILGSLAAGTLLAALVWLALHLMGRRNSRTRFALCFAALVGIAALPFAGLWKSAAAPGAANAWLHLPASWATYLFAAWASVAAFGLVRLAYALFRLHQLRRSCAAVDRDEVAPRVLQALDDFQSVRRITLCRSEALRVPAAIGLWNPAIVLPGWCLRELAPDELHSVVLHELEHLRRYDDWTNLLERIVGAVFFFHPAVWWLENRLSLEREMACDDAVLSQVPDPTRYAKCLVTLAEKSFLRHGVALAQAAVSRMHQLSARIAQILDARRSRSTRIWTPVFSIVAAAAAAGGASMSITPSLIAFQPAPLMLAQSSIPSGAIDRSYLPALAPASNKEVQNGAHFRPQAVPTRLTAAATRHVAHRAASAKPTMAPPAPAQLNRSDTPPPLNAALALRSPASAEAPTAAPAQMLIMVVHTEQQDSSGAVWKVEVVRWVIYQPQPARALDPAIPSKT